MFSLRVADDLKRYDSMFCAGEVGLDPVTPRDVGPVQGQESGLDSASVVA